MKKITIMLMIAFAASTVSGFAGDKKDTPKGKTKAKSPALCTMKSCCKKSTSRAALLKAGAVKKGA